MSREAQPAGPGEAGWDAIDARVREDVARQGFHLALVPPEAGTPGWAFTVGLAQAGAHPELVAFAPDLDFARTLVGGLALRVRAGQRFADGEQAEHVIQGFPVAFRTVTAKWSRIFLGNAAWFHGDEDFASLQCFWPDRDGHFPWQPGFDASWRADQPLLYEHATHEALSEPLIEVLRQEGAL